MTIPVLLLTADDALYRHWSGLDGMDWAPARGHRLADLAPWGRRGVLVVMDARLLPKAGADVPDVPAGLQVVVASTHPGDPEGQRALVAGAVGYVHAYMPVTGLDRVLRHVMGGEIWVGKGMLSRMLSQIGQAAPEPNQDWARDLTVRERDVARYVALGHSNQSIADSLGITERTVRAHISAIFEKLGVTDRLMLALRVHGIDQHAAQAASRSVDA
ncbi:response regulator transcription factor [Castellaniella daejeonensis]|jgi:DNA-binding NarL/FixJ family response regulator|uniref:Response regulator transcription factor n=1 Tax=Castellaniella daejeonensis TaxID=659013 RepID=A0ABP3CXP1_9BURK|nr:response regulator transcription factor [Castellaniella sp.]HET8703215.1 response regulator transcription factor [Castellaniella sp.]